MFMGSLWDKYDSDTTYDEYLGEDNKLRKQAKVISSILEKIGSKKLQEIEKNEIFFKYSSNQDKKKELV